MKTIQARLIKSSAKQLAIWHKRTLRRGNNLQDVRDKIAIDTEESWALTEQIEAHDRLCAAILAELTSRSARAKVIPI